MRVPILNTDSSDRYVYTSTKPITYTNAKGDKLKLTANDVFWYLTVGHREIISAHPLGQGPIFRLTEDQISTLSERADPQPTKEFTARLARKHAKFFNDNYEDLKKNVLVAVRKMVERRNDDSTFHVVSDCNDDKISAKTDVKLSSKTKYGRAINVSLTVLRTKNSVRLMFVMPKDVERKELIVKMPFTQDALEVFQNLRSFWKKKYGLQFEAPMFSSMTSNLHTPDITHQFVWGSAFTFI
jgi:hypothetical protein